MLLEVTKRIVSFVENYFMQLAEKVTKEILDDADFLAAISKAANRKPRSIIRMCEEKRHDRFFYMPVARVIERHFGCKFDSLVLKSA